MNSLDPTICQKRASIENLLSSSLLERTLCLMLVTWGWGAPLASDLQGSSQGGMEDLDFSHSRSDDVRKRSQMPPLKIFSKKSYLRQAVGSITLRNVIEVIDIKQSNALDLFGRRFCLVFLDFDASNLYAAPTSYGDVHIKVIDNKSPFIINKCPFWNYICA